MDVFVHISIGELIDKLTILTIKLEKIQNPHKRENVHHEYILLKNKKDTLKLEEKAGLRELEEELQVINRKLWDIEDTLRHYEYQQDFGEEFIALARSVYKTNDIRSILKKKINQLCGSSIIEEKSYPHV